MNSKRGLLRKAENYPPVGSPLAVLAEQLRHVRALAKVMASAEDAQASPWRRDRQISIGEAEEKIALETVAAWLEANDLDPVLLLPLVNLHARLSDAKASEADSVHKRQVLLLCALEELWARDKSTARFGPGPMKLREAARQLAREMPNDIGIVIKGRKATVDELAEGIVNLRERAMRTKKNSREQRLWPDVTERLEGLAKMHRKGKLWTEHTRQERAALILDALGVLLRA